MRRTYGFHRHARPAGCAGLVTAGSVVLVAVLGIVTTLVVSWCLSKTVLRGATSVYSLELPPYRPPQVLRTIYTSVVDRTLKVLWRAVVMAAPAGAVIWLIDNPCSTTILTIWKETRSLKWTTTATLLPLALAFLVTFTTARLAGWIQQ